MPISQYHDTPDLVIAATRWLMRRYPQTGCNKFASTAEPHLSWMENRSASRHLSVTRGVSGTGGRGRSSTLAHAINCV